MKRTAYIMFLLILAMLMTTACGKDEGAQQNTVQITPDPVVTPAPTPVITPLPQQIYSAVPCTMNMVLEGAAVSVSGIRYTSQLGYTMDYDTAWLSPLQYAGYDHYSVVSAVNVPELYLRVTLESDPQAVVVARLLNEGAVSVGAVEIGGCEGVQLERVEGYDAFDNVVYYYVVQAGEQVYCIETGFYWEVAETFGARVQYSVQSMKFEGVGEPHELRIIIKGREMRDFTAALGWVTHLELVFADGEPCKNVEWVVKNEEVCEVEVDKNNSAKCEVKIVGVGTTRITATCDGEEIYIVVRGVENM